MSDHCYSCVIGQNQPHDLNLIAREAGVGKGGNGRFGEHHCYNALPYSCQKLNFLLLNMSVASWKLPTHHHPSLFPNIVSICTLYLKFWNALLLAMNGCRNSSSPVVKNDCTHWLSPGSLK